MAARCFLTRRLFKILAERLDIGGDVQRLDIGELAEFVVIAPVEEPRDGAIVRLPRVLVADGGGEEFQKAAGGMVAGGGDHARHQHAGAARDAF